MSKLSSLSYLIQDILWWGSLFSENAGNLQSISTLPVVDGGSSQNHGVIIGPFGSVTPTLLITVPEMTAGRVSHNPLRETLPYCEGKIHLQETEMTQNQHEQQFNKPTISSSAFYNGNRATNSWARPVSRWKLASQHKERYPVQVSNAPHTFKGTAVRCPPFSQIKAFKQIITGRHQTRQGPNLGWI